MFNRTLAVVAVVLGLAAFTVAAPAPMERARRKAAPDDMSQLVGTWKMIENGRVGFNAGLAGRGLVRRGEFQTKIKIENDKFAYLYFDGREYRPSTTYDVKIQPGTNPKHIDLNYNSGDITIHMKGIYKIDGKQLTIVYVQNYSSKLRNLGMPEQERPSSFDSGTGNTMQMVLERE